jgi:hypothetical protein
VQPNSHVKGGAISPKFFGHKISATLRTFSDIGTLGDIEKEI